MKKLEESPCYAKFYQQMLTCEHLKESFNKIKTACKEQNVEGGFPVACGE